MLLKKDVFDILLFITFNLGLYPNKFINIREKLRPLLLCIFFIFPWILICVKLSLRQEIDIFKLIIFVTISVNVVRLIHFHVMKLRLIKLHDDLVTVFKTGESISFIESAEKKSRNFFLCLFFLLTPTIFVALINILLADDLVVPLYKPQLWEYSGIVYIIYVLLQCGFAVYGYVTLWVFDLVFVCFLIHLQEVSKFLGNKFKLMKTNKDLKSCVEMHSKFLK